MLLSKFDPEGLHFTFVEYEKGGVVSLSYGNEPALGLVISGNVLVYSTCVDGTSICLTAHSPGECFGVASLFTGMETATLLECDRKTTVAYLPRSVFIRLTEENPELMRMYGLLLNQKISFLTQKIEFLALPSCRLRLACYLLKNCREDIVELAFCKEQLAKVIGVGRASLFRELGRLKKEGYISVNGKRIVLIKKDQLIKIVHQ